MSIVWHQLLDENGRTFTYSVMGDGDVSIALGADETDVFRLAVDHLASLYKASQEQAGRYIAAHQSPDAPVAAATHCELCGERGFIQAQDMGEGRSMQLCATCRGRIADGKAPVRRVNGGR